MSMQMIGGVVCQGVIVPDTPPPEGRRVEITITEGVPEMPPELAEEIRAWNRASDKALEQVERLGAESSIDEKR